ncbi:hypothetical protein M970_060890 [Encephalitozoon cuniculi EcunIII-L]|nr:hypothetical protein M970_060890 [Encephalitozoon cuniculi EcunIII-L]
MSKTLQTKIGGSRSSQMVEVVLVVVLSFLLFDRKVPITKDEAEFARNLMSYGDRKFCFHRHLPLPGLICHGLCRLFAALNIPLLSLAAENPRLVSFTLFVVTMLQISWLAQETYNRMVSRIVVAVHTIGLLINTQIMFLTNEMFSICFLASAIVQLKKRRNAISGALLGLSVASSWVSLSVLPPLAVFHGISLFTFIVDPSNKVCKGALRAAKGVVAFVLVPASVYALSFLVHYSIQHQHTADARGFSIEFQAALKDSIQESADKYLMDRSIITILNQKHNTYLNMRAGIPSCSSEKTEDSMWMVIKVHPSDSNGNVGEQDRYIGHGDLVKIVELGSSMCLRVGSEDTEDKFRKVLGFVQEDNDANEEDIWQIIGSGPVVSRSSLVRFRHYKTAMDLCVRNLRKPEEDGEDKMEKAVNGSLYSDNRSRLFYISDNRNHDFFKKNFSDGRPAETVANFPQKSFWKRILEHHRRLIKGFRRRWALVRRYALLPLQNGKTRQVKHDILFNVLTMLSSFLLPVVLVLNHISWRKYGKGLVTREDNFFICMMHLCAVLIETTLNLGQALTEVLRIWMALSLVSLFGTRPVFLLFSVFLSSSMRFLR